MYTFRLVQDGSSGFTTNGFGIRTGRYGLVEWVLGIHEGHEFHVGIAIDANVVSLCNGVKVGVTGVVVVESWMVMGLINGVDNGCMMY